MPQKKTGTKTAPKKATAAPRKPEPDAPLHVVELTVSNVLRLKAVHIRPTGNAVVLEGRNGNGKSSVLHAIAMAIGGKRLCPENPIRQGETSAEIDIDLGEFRVTRHWITPERDWLRIERKDGQPVTRPQEFLDTLVGKLSWNPLAFASMAAKDRLESIRKACGIDTTVEEAVHKTAYDARRDVNRDLDKVRKELEGLATIPDTADTRSVTEIRKEYDRAVKHNGEIEGAEERLTEKREEYARVNKEIKERQKRLAEIVEEAKGLEETKAKPKKDVTKLRKEMTDAESAAETRGKIERKAAATKEQKQYEAEVKELEKKMDAANEEKARKIREAKLPAGLGLGEEDVTLNNLPFAQASRAEQLKASLGVCMAGNPRIKILLVEDASIADGETMRMIEEEAAAKGWQIWLERAADEKTMKGAIFIEDGGVSE